MKKITLLGALACFAMLFSACNDESYQHRVAVVYPEGAMGFVYADQTVDSITFLTFDTYRYYAVSSNPDNFISISEKNASQKIDNVYYQGYYVTLPVYFKANDTTSPRLGYVAVDSKSEMDDWSGTTYGTYFQANWHCISKPSPNYKYNKDNSLIESCSHVMRDSAYQVTDTLQFYAYDKWTLASADAEIVAPKITSGMKGWQKVPCDITKNLGSDTIRTTLLLKSENGAKTTIDFQQAPKKKVEK